MKKLAIGLVAFVALQHFGFLVLEMFLWTDPIGMKVFKTTAAVAESSKTLAANQGLYNGFLAAGLVWSLFRHDCFHLKMFFLGCVIVAGIFGAVTVSPRIFLVQAVPAILALGATYVGARPSTESA